MRISDWSSDVCSSDLPVLRTAEGFFQSGRHCWNAGIFLCSAKTLLREMERFAPETLQVARMATERAEKDRNFLRLDRQAYLRAPNISIDHAVMELRSEEHTSELQSLVLISYAVFCLKK